MAKILIIKNRSLISIFKTLKDTLSEKREKRKREEVELQEKLELEKLAKKAEAEQREKEKLELEKLAKKAEAEQREKEKLARKVEAEQREKEKNEAEKRKKKEIEKNKKEEVQKKEEIDKENEKFGLIERPEFENTKMQIGKHENEKKEKVEEMEERKKENVLDKEIKGKMKKVEFKFEDSFSNLAVDMKNNNYFNIEDPSNIKGKKSILKGSVNNQNCDNKLPTLIDQNDCPNKSCNISKSQKI